MAPEPKTLQAAILYFADPTRCREYIVARRWPDGVTCPRCGSKSVAFQEKYNRWQCATHHDRRQFTLKTGTVFEDSPLGLDKWLCAMWMVVNCKNGVSLHEIARTIGVTQKTAWFMLGRLRMALHGGEPSDKLRGTVEADETYIGGKARNMHSHKKKQLKVKRGRSIAGKVAVMALLERHGKDGHSTVRTEVLGSLKRGHVQGHVRKHVEVGAALYTDSFSSYSGLHSDYTHKVIDHAEAYVDGEVHTNSCENFWSLLKRAIKGTYVSVEPFHLFRYLDEQAFRFNKRGGTDAARFSAAVLGIVGRRLTFADLTGRNMLAEAIN